MPLLIHDIPTPSILNGQTIREVSYWAVGVFPYVAPLQLPSETLLEGGQALLLRPRFRINPRTDKIIVPDLHIAKHADRLPMQQVHGTRRRFRDAPAV